MTATVPGPVLADLLIILLEDHVAIEEARSAESRIWLQRFRAEVARRTWRILGARFNALEQPGDYVPWDNEVADQVARQLDDERGPEQGNEPPPETAWQLAISDLVQASTAAGIDEDSIRRFLACRKLGGLTEADATSAEIARLDRDGFAARLVELLRGVHPEIVTTIERLPPAKADATSGAPGTSKTPICCVTMLQMGGIVSRSKPTIERLKKKGKLPPPTVKGGNGRADEWDWALVRPILVAEYKRPDLPEHYPTDPFGKRR
jgi:hypothetical protein